MDTTVTSGEQADGTWRTHFETKGSRRRRTAENSGRNRLIERLESVSYEARWSVRFLEGIILDREVLD